TYAGQARELSTEWLYVGNSFSQELNFGQINPQLLPTKWNINICDPDTQNFKEGTINLAWGSNYWTASIDSTITTYYFLTVSFNKAQIEKILKGATKVAFSPGFVDLTIAEHAPECVESGIGPKIRIEILTAFALNDNNEVISNAYLPTESWPVKYPPYNGANKFLLHLTKKPLSFLDKICIFFKRLIPS
ncbi:MAG: hypothetical protein Q8K92_08710, partial [Leadbetterella sp.]|nr:hypothetical protein [Leadbetterella sp.]